MLQGGIITKTPIIKFNHQTNKLQTFRYLKCLDRGHHGDSETRGADGSSGGHSSGHLWLTKPLANNTLPPQATECAASRQSWLTTN